MGPFPYGVGTRRLADRLRFGGGVETQIVTYMLDDGTKVEFEVERARGVAEVSTEDLAGRVREAIGPIVGAARLLLDGLKAVSPDELELTFGVKATGKVNWVVAKAETEGNFGVKLVWKKPSETSSPVPSGD